MPDNGASNTPDLQTAFATLERAVIGLRAALREQDLLAEGPVFGALRAWRTQEARTKQVPPYVVATDAVLRAIEKARPADLADLHAVKGLSAAKVEAYGKDILAVVAGTPVATSS